jgi:hypothetical protein
MDGRVKPAHDEGEDVDCRVEAGNDNFAYPRVGVA